MENQQLCFLQLIQKEGWPVAGKMRNAQVFQRMIQPELQERKKIAYILTDALRFELGYVLAKRLEGTVQNLKIHAVCAQLPTSTPVGMASLLPEADQHLEILEEKEAVVPQLKGKTILTPTDRINYLKTFYGDRAERMGLDEVLQSRKDSPKDTVQLLMITTTDIDNAGENVSKDLNYLIPRILRRYTRVIEKLQSWGFERVVFAADHCYHWFPSRSGGDSVSKPNGDWKYQKRCCLLGQSTEEKKDTLQFSSEEVGIPTSFPHFVVPNSLAAFSQGVEFFHEGLSLQECILPVLSFDLEIQEQSIPTSIELQLSYRGGKSKKITMQRPMVEIAWKGKIPEGQEVLHFRFEAYAKGELVGNPGPCKQLNEESNLIVIQAGESFKIPLRMDGDFEGKFEVRAIDPKTQISYGSLKLETDYQF